MLRETAQDKYFRPLPTRWRPLNPRRSSRTATVPIFRGWVAAELNSCKMHPSSRQGSTDRPLPLPSRGSVSPRLEEESWEEEPGEEAPQTLGARGRGRRGATAPGARRRGAPAQPATKRKARTTRRGRSREGAGRAAGARRGLQVPACPAAAARPPPPLKGSGSRSRRVAAAFTLPPRLGGRELRARRPTLLASLLP